MLRRYHKALFVRNPLDRLWSAYNSKFVNQNPKFLMKYGRDILRRFRQQPSSTALQCGNDVSFLEFISFVTAEGTPDDNVHWMSYHRLCRPCEVSYDFIGKLETFETDMAYLVWHSKIMNMNGSGSVSSSYDQMVAAAKRTPILNLEKLRGISQNWTSIIHTHCLHWQSFALNRFRFWRNVGFIGGNDNKAEAEATTHCRGLFLDDKDDWRGYDSCLWTATVGRQLGNQDVALMKIKKQKALAKLHGYASIEHIAMTKIYGMYSLDFDLFNYAKQFM